MRLNCPTMKSEEPLSQTELMYFVTTAVEVKHTLGPVFVIFVSDSMPITKFGTRRRRRVNRRTAILLWGVGENNDKNKKIRVEGIIHLGSLTI